MPSTYSQDLRIELIAGGDQSGTWGSTTNNNLGNLIEDAISGAAIIPIDPGSGVKQAIIAANGAVDQARCSALILTGATAAFEIYAPPVTKLYVVRNECGFDATLWCATAINGTTSPVGTTGYIIPAGKTAFVHTPDGLQFYDAVNYLNTALPAGSGGTGFQTYAVGDLLYANTTTSLAKLADVATGNVLRSGGVNTAPAWGKVNLTTDITGNLPVANLNSGTGASATTFWRGDGAWATPGGGGDVSFTGTAPTASVNQVAVYGATGTSITTGRTYQFRATTAGQAQIQLFENATGGATDSITIQTPNTITSSYTLTLPTTAGTNGYVLQTNGSGTLSWVAQPSASGDVVGPASSTNNALVRFDATTGKLIKDSVGILTDAGALSGVTMNASVITAGTLGANRIPSSLNATTLAIGSGAGGTTNPGTSTWPFFTSNNASNPGFVAFNNNSAGTGILCTLGALNPGNQILFQHSTSSTAGAGTLTQVGAITSTNTSTAYATTSDRRLKTNIVPLTNAIPQLNLLLPKRYNWKVDPTGRPVEGFIADELQPVIPDAVVGNPDDVNPDGSIKPQQIDMSYIVPLLTAALQEAVARIEALETQINAM